MRIEMRILLLFFWILFLQACYVTDPVADKNLAKPSPVQYSWHEQERLMFIHFGMATWQGREYDNFSTDLSVVNPTKIDTDEWCRIAQSFGAKQIVFVAKHVGGFCWWPTKTTNYSVENIAWKDGKGDLVSDVAASCKKFGLRFGIYLYPGDEKWGAGIGSGGRTKDSSKQEAYNKIYRQQLLELLTQYGTISEVWFDGTCVIDVKDILDSHAKEAVIFQSPQATIRWVGNEDGYAPYPAWNSVHKNDLQTGVSTAVHGDPNGNAWAPLEVDVPLYKHYWFWSASNEKRRRSLADLMKIYYESVGRGAVLLLNATPDSTGVIPKGDVDRYQEFGDEIRRRFAHPLKRITGVNATAAELMFDTPTVVNHVVLMEDYRYGERIRGYVIEGKVKGKWKHLTAGSSVGRKKIDYFTDQEVTAIRLRVTKQAATPIIRSFEVFNVSNASELFTGQSAEVNDWKYLSSWIPAGTPNGRQTITLNLTPYVPVPGQYELKINSDSVNSVVISGAELWYDGEKALDAFLTVLDTTMLINRTAQVTHETSIVLKITLQSKSSLTGSTGIYFRKRS